MQADANMAVQQKRPDSWVVSWGKQHLLILKFTLPNSKCKCSLHYTDLVKSSLYKSLLDLLVWHLLGWKVEIALHYPDRWYVLLLFYITAARAECLMLTMVSQALKELTDLYCV